MASEPKEGTEPPRRAVLSAIVGLAAVAGFVWWSQSDPAPDDAPGDAVGAAGTTGDVAEPDADPSAEDKFVARGEIMGTTYMLALRGVTEQEGKDIAGRVFEALSAVDASLSTYKQDSELSRFNRAPVGEMVLLSRGFRRMLEISREVNQKSEGAFDPTVGAIVDAWGFGPVDVEAPPTDEDLARLGEAVGLDKIELPDDRRSSRSHELQRLDFSAVAKGWAVDRAAAVIEASEVGDYMIEVGGELRVLGEGAPGRPWRVGIEAPATNAAEGRAVHRVVELSEGAMATSGDYRNYREIDGVRASHTIDPRTAKPITHKLASVSVLHERAADADAWATALNVLGPEEGFEVAEREELDVYMIVREGDGFVIKATPGFEAKLGDAP